MKPDQVGPRLTCPELKDFDPASGEAIRQAFTASPKVNMAQGWRQTNHPLFRPSSIQAGHTGAAIWIYASIEDADIYNETTGFNSPFFLHGDVFEVFLRPAGQEAYYEFHVGPANQQFQLCIPSAAAFLANKANPNAWLNWLIKEPIFKSWTFMDPEHNGWQALVQIPLLNLTSAPIDPAHPWRYSFSRYDYTRGQPEPVHSSTSPHRELNFHRQQEWGELVFT